MERQRKERGMALRRSCYIGVFILVAVMKTHAFGQTTANISVLNEVVKSGLDPAAYCSVNWEVDFDRHAYGKIFSDPHRYNKFVNFLRDDTSMKTFRYPGGTYVDYFFVGIPATQWLPVLKTMNSGISNARPEDWTEVEDFFQFLQDGNFKTILQVNTQYWFDTQTNKIRNIAFKSNSSNLYRDIVDPYGLQKAADAVEQLACYVRDNGLENHVLRWEIGNEEYFFQTSGVYAQIVNAFIPRIKNILPNAQIIVTGATGVFADAYTNQWTNQLIGTLNTNGAINNTTGLVTHMYWASKGTIVPSTSYQEYAGYMSFLPDDKTQHLWYPLYDSSNRIVSIVGQMRDNLAVAGAAGKEIWFTEYRLGGLTERYSTAMAGAIGNIRLLAGLMAAPGVNGACFYSLLHGGYVGAQDQSIGTIPASSLEGYKLMYFYADDNIVSHFVGTPGAQGFRMIEKLSRGNVLKTSSSKQDLFTVATSDDPNRVRVLVVNKASRPEKDNDVTPNEWGFVTQTNALYNNWLAYGDTFNTQITLPTGFVAKSVRIHTLGESHLLDAYSVNIGSMTGIHEIKLDSSAKNINSNTYTYTFI